MRGWLVGTLIPKGTPHPSSCTLFPVSKQPYLLLLPGVVFLMCLVTNLSLLCGPDLESYFLPTSLSESFPPHDTSTSMVQRSLQASNERIFITYPLICGFQFGEFPVIQWLYQLHVFASRVNSRSSEFTRIRAGFVSITCNTACFSGLNSWFDINSDNTAIVKMERQNLIVCVTIWSSDLCLKFKTVKQNATGKYNICKVQISLYSQIFY